MKSGILILAAAALLAACGGNTQKKAAAGGTETVAGMPDMHTAETSLDYQGTYAGTARRSSTTRSRRTACAGSTPTSSP